jgi:hypothetical protein
LMKDRKYNDKKDKMTNYDLQKIIQ